MISNPFLNRTEHVHKSHAKRLSLITSANTFPLKSKPEKSNSKRNLESDYYTTKDKNKVDAYKITEETHWGIYSISKHGWNDINKEIYLLIDQLWPLNGKKKSVNNILKETL